MCWFCCRRWCAGLLCLLWHVSFACCIRQRLARSFVLSVSTCVRIACCSLLVCLLCQSFRCCWDLLSYLWFCVWDLNCFCMFCLYCWQWRCVCSSADCWCVVCILLFISTVLLSCQRCCSAAAVRCSVDCMLVMWLLLWCVDVAVLLTEIVVCLAVEVVWILDPVALELVVVVLKKIVQVVDLVLE